MAARPFDVHLCINRYLTLFESVLLLVSSTVAFLDVLLYFAVVCAIDGEL